MARSTDLRTEANAMARIEAAYASLEELDPAMRRRVLRYGAETAAAALNDNVSEAEVAGSGTAAG